MTRRHHQPAGPGSIPGTRVIFRVARPFNPPYLTGAGHPRIPSGPRSCTASRHLVTCAFSALALLAGACTPNATPDQRGDETMPSKTIEQVLQEHTDEWMAIPGVEGTGIGKCDDEPCIRIFVARKTPELAEKFPERIDGHLIDIVETGRFQARDTGGS